jgi:hypothetical protein
MTLGLPNLFIIKPEDGIDQDIYQLLIEIMICTMGIK